MASSLRTNCFLFNSAIHLLIRHPVPDVRGWLLAYTQAASAHRTFASK